MSHFEVWGSAMVDLCFPNYNHQTTTDAWSFLAQSLKQDGTATIDRPPNHKLFDTISDSNLGLNSPIQLHRMQAQNKENAPMSTQIHNHITLLDNLFTMLQG